MTNTTGIEVEYKFEILPENQEHLEREIKAIGFEEKTPRTYESNVMFDNPQGLMQKEDARIRVRTKGDKGNKVLTYKKPLPPQNGAKREIEHEIHFDDPFSNIEKILEAIQFTPSSSYERYRTTFYNKEYDVELTVDEYPFTTFVEIEGKQEDIEKIATWLTFDLSKGLTKPADTLFQQWRKKKGLPFQPHMTFDTYDK